MPAHDEPPRPSKLEVMRALLEHAEAQVHFDARKRGVRLPERLLGSPNVRLDYGYGLVPPIPDLTIDEDGIHATLSFNRIPFETFVPWSAVFLVADFSGRGAVWREDLPSELAAELTPEANVDPAAQQHVTQRDIKPARKFTVLDGDEGTRGPDDEAANDDGGPERDPEPPKPRPALRLVK